MVYLITISGCCFTPKDILLESATESLQSSHQAHESDDVEGIDVIQTIRNSGEAGTRGDDWEEVSFMYMCVC